jgi:hypothetical protein
MHFLRMHIISDTLNLMIIFIFNSYLLIFTLIKFYWNSVCWKCIDIFTKAVFPIICVLLSFFSAVMIILLFSSFWFCRVYDNFIKNAGTGQQQFINGY